MKDNKIRSKNPKVEAILEMFEKYAQEGKFKNIDPKDFGADYERTDQINLS